MKSGKKVMRDIFIERIYHRMHHDKTLFFLAADFGSPKLDKIRTDFRARYINVGIAEQNLINVATGLALEGFTVYAYAIAPFLTMRAYEQIRNNLALLSHTHGVNVNLIGVGAGLSYDVSGPTHHALEDISIMRTLPNLTIFSPSDWVLAERFVDYTVAHKSPKYIRFDGKPVHSIYENLELNLESGFHELSSGEEICLISTGYMTHTALKVIDRLSKDGIEAGLIDIFLLSPIEEDKLFQLLNKYRIILSLEEAFVGKGGMDSLLSSILSTRGSNVQLKRMGFGDEYSFNIGSREYLHRLSGLDEESIIAFIKELLV